MTGIVVSLELDFGGCTWIFCYDEARVEALFFPSHELITPVHRDVVMVWTREAVSRGVLQGPYHFCLDSFVLSALGTAELHQARVE